MMLTPRVYITINNKYRFKGCQSFEVENDVDKISMQGEVVLPLTGMFVNDQKRDKLMIFDLISTGDRITITAGYMEDRLHDVFSGYISRVDRTTQVSIKFEDAVFLLRQKSVVIDLQDTTVKEICKEILSGINGLSVSEKTQNIKVDEFKHNGNAARALSQLKEDLSLSAYFDGTELYCGGRQLNPKDQITAVYGRNVIKNNTSYIKAEENPLKVEVIGKLDSGEEVKVVAGMEGGNKQTFYVYNVTDKETLRAKAEEYLAKYSFDGFEGTLELWGIPCAEAGGSVKYINKNYADQEGVYFVKSVKHSKPKGKGLRQKIKLGARLS